MTEDEPSDEMRKSSKILMVPLSMTRREGPLLRSITLRKPVHFEFAHEVLQLS